MPIKSLAVAGLVAAAALVYVGPAAAANRHVNIVNKTGHTMTEFYASVVSTNDWQEDILGRDTLDPGDTVDVNIDDGSGACRFDFKAVFDDGDSVIKHNINVCEISSFSYTE